ncbi:MAG: LTA synthase family protein [Clostridia bacterium]|nr:LTA synthase family protein [Clostridia bacterium]
MEKRWPRVAAMVCLWLPFVALLIKNILLQEYLTGNNAYTLDVWAGLSATLPSLPLQAAVTALLFSPCFLFKGRGRYRYGLILNVVFTVILCIDLVYYRCYNVIPAAVMIPVAFSQGGTQTIADTLPTLFVWSDLWLLADFAVWGVLYAVCRRYGWLTPRKPKRRPLITGVMAGVSVLTVAFLPLLSLLGIDGGAYRRVYVTADTVKQTRLFSSAGFHGADLWQTAWGQVTETTLSAQDEQLLDDYFSWKNADTTQSDYTGRFAGKNLMVIQVESLESFVLGRTLDGQAITPNLNRLMSGGYYFPHIQEQVKCGNSSDCDFMLMTGLLPVDRSYVFGTYDDNAYRSLPQILKDHGGYTSYYFHGAANATWNYEGMLTDALGMERLNMDYEQDEKLNGYLSDESFFRQTLEKLDKQPLDEPFYAHVVTCSSHIPCKVPQGYNGLTMDEELASNPLGRYLNAVHYTDEQIGVFLDELEKRGLLDNTLIMVVGDHGGVHKYYPHYTDEVSDAAYEDWFGRGGQYSLPLILYSRDITQPREFSVVGGQVDVLPTLLAGLGIEEKTVSTVMFGRDLFSTSRSFAIGNDGRLYGKLSVEEYDMVKYSFYLSDLIIRSGRTVQE